MDVGKQKVVGLILLWVYFEDTGNGMTTKIISDKEPHTGTIYIATNLETGKQYVGQTVNFKRRQRRHLTDKANTYFSRTIQKYGLSQFIFMQNIYPENELNYWERHWIKELKTFVPDGYNMTTGGEQGLALLGNKNCVGHHHTEETKRKVGLARRGKKMSESQKEQLRKFHTGLPSGMLGKKHTEETRRKMSISHMGHPGSMLRHHTEETKKKMGDAMRGRRASPETREKMKAAWLRRRGKP